MKNTQLFLGAIVLGVIVLIVGILFVLGLFGTHHSLPYILIGLGVLLLIVGIVGMVVGKPKSAA